MNWFRRKNGELYFGHTEFEMSLGWGNSCPEAIGYINTELKERYF
jgi:hypothetical protein